MNRKLGRLLRPGMGAYFFVMAAFCAAALLVGHYWLAAGEMAVTVVTFLLYVLDRTRRERKISSISSLPPTRWKLPAAEKRPCLR